MSWEPKMVWVLSFRVFYPPSLVTGDGSQLIILRRVVTLMEIVIVEVGVEAEISKGLLICGGWGHLY